MSNTDRVKYLRIAIVVFGSIFLIIGIYPLAIIWPSVIFASSVIGDPRKSSQFSFSPVVSTTNVSPTHFPLE